MIVTSNSFLIEKKYHCDSENISIPIKIKSVPINAKSLALIFYDLNPYANNWIHWEVLNIPISDTNIEEGISGKKYTELVNSFGTIGYGGPCPPISDGIHQYQLSLFALDIENIEVDVNILLYYSEFKERFKNNIIEESIIIGLALTEEPKVSSEIAIISK